MNFGRQRCDVDGGVGERRQHVADIVRRDGREIALQIDHDLDLPLGVEQLHRLKDPIRAGGVVGAGHDRLAAMRPHRGGDIGRVGRDRDPADLSGFRPAQHMDDHRQAADIQQRLAGQAGRRHAGGNQHQSAGFCHRERGRRPDENRPEIVGIGRKLARFTGLPEAGQTDISTLLRVRRESLIPEAFPRPFLRP